MLLTLALTLGACSSAPKVVNNQQQYCNTDQVIVNKDNDVSSETVVTCTDRVDMSMITKSGIADTCREYYYIAGGKYKRGFICRKLNVNGGHGGWEIVNPKFMH